MQKLNDFPNPGFLILSKYDFSHVFTNLPDFFKACYYKISGDAQFNK